MLKTGGFLGVCSVLVCLATSVQAQVVGTDAIPDANGPEQSEKVAVGTAVNTAVNTAGQPVKAEGEGSETEVSLRDDPFSLEGISETVPEVSLRRSGFRPADVLPPRMPGMTLRGIGRMSDQDKPTALIDIEKFGLFIVTEDDTISLQGIPGDNVLRIVKINENSVTVEAGSFGELIVVR